MVQAHPFRERFYLEAIKLHPTTVHGIEVVNGENDGEFDREVRAYALTYNLSRTSGIDIHTATKVGPASKGMAFSHLLGSI